MMPVLAGHRGRHQQGSDQKRCVCSVHVGILTSNEFDPVVCAPGAPAHRIRGEEAAARS